MSGRFSRSKGRREEQQLVIYLSKLGFKAERILRQYQTAGQPDVIATKEGKTYTFEKKARQASFKTIYDLYYKEHLGYPDRAVRFVLNSSGTAVAMSTDLTSLFEVGRVFRNLTLFPPDKKEVKVYERIVRLKDLKQSADFLVIKDNNKAQLFLRFWG